MKMFEFTALKLLHKDMIAKGEERATFPFEFNGKIFSSQIAITSWTPRGKNLGHGWSRRIYP